MTAPASMTCIEISSFGGPEVLLPVQRPCPTPGPGEVLIEVAAAGINRPDVFQREGKYPPPPGASDLPGLEVSGLVVAAGTGVSTPKIGDAVCSLLSGGGYAQYAVANAALCLPVPAGMDLTAAAALPEALFTVWHTVFERGRLQPGETFLVHGGTSGIGTTAIQMAKALGATVFTTAGSDEKCRACEKLGADRAINYRTEDFVTVLREHGGADVVLDMVGGDYIMRNIKAMKVEGRHVSIAFLQGSRMEIDLMPVMLKRLSMMGSVLRAQSTEAKARMATVIREKVWPLLETGQISPHIDTKFPLTAAADAHRLMESSAHIGKILLTCSPQV